MNELIKWVEAHPVETAALALLVWYLRSRAQQQTGASGPQQLQEIYVPNVKYEAMY